MVKKIVTRICGGLGNQMFSYAVGEKLAREHNVPQEFDLIEYFSSNYIFKKGISTRQYQLDCFKGPKRYRIWPITKSLALWLLAAIDLAFKREFFRRSLAFFGMHLYRSNSLFFPDADPNPKGLSTIYSTWLMFSIDRMPTKDILRKEFELANPLSPENEKIAEAISNGESIALHVRRTDYLMQATPWTLSNDYYNRAIDIINMRITCPKWFIFSDDPDWCRIHFKTLPNALFVSGNNNRPWEDLELMKRCRHHIIANSTFSWWSAYLAKDGGTIIYPRNWGPYAPKELPRTFIPESWIGVS